jgi:hypothetical protein
MKINMFGLLKDKPLWAALLCTAVMIFLSGTIPYTVLPFSHWDLLNYRTMAQAVPHLDFSVCPPYTYRILGPYLVGLMPMNDVHAFYLLAVILSFILVIAYYSLVRRLGLSSQTAALTTILFTLNRYFFGFTVWDYFQINDLISEILLALLFISMLQGAWFRYALLLLAGALTRETVFIIVPTTLVYLWENKKIKNSLMPFLTAVLPGLMVFIGLRILIKSTCTDHEPGLPQSGAAYYYWAFLRYLHNFFLPQTLFRRLINAFAPFSFLPIIFLGQTKSLVVRHRHMAVFYLLIFAATLFGGDAERLMAPAFIVFYFLLGLIIEKTIASKPFAIATAIVLAFLTTLHSQNARFKLPSQKYAILFSMGSLCLMTGFSIWYRISHRKKSLAQAD